MHHQTNTMNFNILHDVLDLVEEFNLSPLQSKYGNTIEGFKRWIHDNQSQANFTPTIYQGANSGRSPESAIATALVHLNRFGKIYSKWAMIDSEFTTQDEFIFLITLQTFGPMTKMELIKKNIQDKPLGMQVISRLILQNWVNQKDNDLDKRSKIISITPQGEQTLSQHMEKIRRATKIVSGNLTLQEKHQLISLLNKLEDFHIQLHQTNPDATKLESIASKL